MATTKKLTRRQHRITKIRKQKRVKRMQIGLIAAGILILAVSLGLMFQNRALQTGLSYQDEDVVYDQPMLAIHEMDGAKINEITFLPKDGPQPAIAVSEDFYSFGLIGATDIVTYQFAIFNQGEAPLTISRAYTTCGCTTAEFSATVIPPGKVSLMKLTLDAGYHDVRGQNIRRGIIIENNDPKNPSIEIWTQAQVSQN